MRRFNRQFLNRVGHGCCRIILWLARGAAQNGIDKTGGGSHSGRAHKFNRLVYRCRWRDASEEPELIQPYSQRYFHRRIEVLNPSTGEILKCAIKPEPAAQDAKHQLVTQRPVVSP